MEGKYLVDENVELSNALAILMKKKVHRKESNNTYNLHLPRLWWLLL